MRYILIILITLLMNSSLLAQCDFKFIEKDFVPYVSNFHKYLIKNGVEADFTQRLVIVYGDTGEATGVAHGRGEHGVFIRINKNIWHTLSTEQKHWVIYHELAHDMFDLGHGNIKLMNPEASRNVSFTKFDNARKEFIEHVK
jgi:hypothetical protein